jgi:hypothetical protein
MKRCCVCDEPTKLDYYAFCEVCFNSSREETERRYLEKRFLETHEDQKDPEPTKDSYEPCRSKTFYSRSKEILKEIFFLRKVKLARAVNREERR